MTVHPGNYFSISGDGGIRPSSVLCILCKPDGGEVAPTEFSDDDVTTIGKLVAYFDWMVATLDVVLPILLIFGHDGLRLRRV